MSFVKKTIKIKKQKVSLEQAVIYIFKIFIRFYQIFISPLFGTNCRFYPSCSEYFIKALKHKGVVKGSIAGVARIARCNPFNAGGYDPVKE